jgi:hypothetical protein
METIMLELPVNRCGANDEVGGSKAKTEHNMGSRKVHPGESKNQHS